MQSSVEGDCALRLNERKRAFKTSPTCMVAASSSYLNTALCSIDSRCTTFSHSPIMYHELAERKTGEMDTNIQTVQEEIKELQAERALLLAKLEKVELSLAKAQAKKVSSICVHDSPKQPRQISSEMRRTRLF